MPSFRQRVAAALAGWKTGRVRVHAPKGISLAELHRKGVEKASRRSYSGANYDRLTEDFLGPLTTGDAEMRTRIRILRQRARELERNEPYSKRFLSRLEDNVYDHNGMTFSSLAGTWRRRDGSVAFDLDENDAKAIEISYAKWRENPFVTGDMDANEGGRLALRSVARDGDMFGRFVVDSSINEFGFAVQLLEADMCDDYKNELERGGDGKVQRQVRMGVEVNTYFRPTAFWILKDHPGDQQWWNTQGYWSERHPADQYVHPFHRERITQCRDVTWLHAIMRDLKMLDGYDEAAIVAARTGAAKMGFLTRAYNEAGAPYTGDEASDETMGGDKAMDAEPGLIEDLSQSPGLQFQKWDPAYPHEQYVDFVKSRVRRIGAGLDMSYYAVANDLTEVNFSSIRAGLLEDRERFKTLQSWWCNQWERRLFLKWLEIALLTGAIKDPVTMVSLPFSKLEKFGRHKFRPRRWPWVDPEKDVQADILAVDNRFKSRSAVVEEHTATTFDEVLAEISREQEKAEDANVELPPVAGGPQIPIDGDAEPPDKPSGGKNATGGNKG